MTTALYALTKAAMLQGAGPNLAGGTLKAIPVTAVYAPDFTVHANLDDVDAGARAALPQTLTSKTVNAAAGLAVFDADDLVFPGVATGDPITGLVVYLDSGSEATSTLLGYFDYFANLPLTPDSRDVVFHWPTDTNKVFSF